MSTDVAVPTAGQAGTLAPRDSISAIVSSYASDLRDCMALADQIVDTEIVPPSFWPAVAVVIGDEAKVLKAWEWDPRRKHPKESAEDYDRRRRAALATTGGVIHVGATLGHTSYFQSITGIYFVGGRPALMSEEMRSQVLRAGHHLRVIVRTPTVAEVEARRRGEQDAPRKYVFTIDDAEAAGYVPGKGPNAGVNKWGKPNTAGNPKYLTDPATMLVARVTTIACRLEFPDVIRGFVAAELTEDDRPAQPVDITASVEVSRPAERPTAAAILAAAGQSDNGENENPADVTPPAAPVERAILPITPGRWNAINAQLNALGINGDGQQAARLRIVSKLAGRDEVIAKGSDLTADEGRQVWDSLAANGINIAWEILGEQSGFDLPARPTPASSPAADEALDADQDADDPNGQWDGMDGAEAAAEGQ